MKYTIIILTLVTLLNCTDQRPAVKIVETPTTSTIYHSGDASLDMVVKIPFTKSFMDQKYYVIHPKDSMVMKNEDSIIFFAGERADFLDTIILNAGEKFFYTGDSTINQNPTQLNEISKFLTNSNEKLKTSIQELMLEIPEELKKAESIFFSDFQKVKYVGIPYRIDRIKFNMHEESYANKLDETFAHIDSTIRSTYKGNLDRELRFFMLEYYVNMAKHIRNNHLYRTINNRIENMVNQDHYFSSLYVDTYVNVLSKYLPNNASKKEEMVGILNQFSNKEFVGEAKRLIVKRELDQGSKKYKSIEELLKNYEISNDSIFIAYIDSFYMDIKEKNQMYHDKLISALSNQDPHKTYEQTIESHKGNLVLVDFWASWCVPCRISLPKIKEIDKKYKSKGLKTIFVSIDRYAKQWETAIVKENLVNSSNYYLPNFKTSSIRNDLKIKSIPRYFLYGRDGNLIYSQINSEKIEDAIVENL